jgi:hypothetical protein
MGKNGPVFEFLIYLFIEVTVLEVVKLLFNLKKEIYALSRSI